ncbi:hypothetical protein FT663_03739 [Candidozyma haemuli var. vulneris]|uniref:BTB domain-containing protein n=1 Tax=Candidozyma haemuli TaxID=45357 RepID=A0A2V1AL85_9ASCO|nr:hypothetical protein CXQ85_000931 [[Candida] haemuloni]KAF3987600.1 hypothetical protein FT662_03906 [[Candida] haemuloni var. vulneris]KAF3989142.1 hypothetical protein FT663_03739 [[Candida] haemuloni var. vulneris]PVH18649.1 hypothetical protein CXQ85_000931 [[Candida] haemuloni]
MPSESLDIPTGSDLPMNHSNVPSSDGRHAASSNVNLENAYKELLWACRIGDTVMADSLTLLPELDINKVDEWDYSPLILASLCGRLEIVKMLLARGAVCERDTFQGARCIYGALTDDIRNLLLSYNISKKTDEDQPFSAHLSSLLSPALTVYACKDIAFVFPHEHDRSLQVFVVNRFLLSARSSYFRKRFSPEGKWYNASTLKMSKELDARVFRSIVDYMYLRTDSLPLEDPSVQLLALCAKFSLDLLRETLSDETSKKPKAVKSRQGAELTFVKGARQDMGDFFEGHVLPNVLVKSLDEIDLSDVKYGGSDIKNEKGENEVEFQDLDVSRILSFEEKESLLKSTSIPDAILCSLDLDSSTIVFYPVHRAMLVRAKFYQTIFDPSWSAETANLPLLSESKYGTAGQTIIDRALLVPQDIPVIHAYMGATRREVSEAILRFLYYNDSIVIDPEIAVETLLASDELNIDRLKSISTVSLTNFVDGLKFETLKALPSKVGYDVFELIELAWRLQTDRLEQHMTKLIAHNIEAVCEDKELREKLLDLIRASAHRIEERQATDTIEVVDDMRYYLAKKFAVYDEFTNLEGIGASLNPNMAEPEDNRTFKAALLDYEHDVAIVDQLLDELGLEA